MSRKIRKNKRDLLPDPKFKSLLVARFVNYVMERGKKNLAQTIVYKTFEKLENDLKKNPVEVFEQAVRNVSPQLEVKSKRVGGATYQVPYEVRGDRKKALAMKWMIDIARKRQGKEMSVFLAEEILNAFNNTGEAIRKKDDLMKQAEANRAFAHFARY